MAKGFSFSDNYGDITKIEDYINYYRSKNITFYKGFMDVDYQFHIMDLFDNFFNNPENMEEFLIDSFDKADFQYNAKGLSDYLYGTPDMWWVICRCNGLDHPGELDLSSGKIIVPRAPEFDAYVQKVYHMKDEYFVKLGHKW